MSRPTVRPAEAGDLAGFLRLVRGHLSEVGDDLWDEEWARWKYESNPCVDRRSLAVAVDERRVVGAVGVVPTTVQFEGVTFTAAQPTDVVVHPDHRSGLLFDRLVETAMTQLSETEFGLVYGRPRESTVEAWIRLRDWTPVATLRRSWRVQNVGGFVGDMTESRRLAEVARLGQPAVTLYNAVSSGPPTTDLAVEATDEVPVETLSMLYESAVPLNLHVVRTRQFYEWRMRAAPYADYRTFLARRGGEVVGALVTSRWHGRRVVRIADLLPLPGTEPDSTRDLIAAAVAGHRDAAAIRAPPAISERMRRELGFSHTRYLERLSGLPGIDRVAADAVPSWNVHYAARMTDAAPTDRVPSWDRWTFTGIEVDTA